MGEVFVRNNEGKLYWGYKTRCKRWISVNRPAVFGFEANMALEPIQLILVGVGKSKKIKNEKWMYDLYYTWLKKLK